MKKYLLLFSVVIISLTACNKNEVTVQAVVDDEKIQAYIKANNVTGLTKDPTGFYYKVLIPGTGPYPFTEPVGSLTPASTIQYSYTGTFLNGQTFQQETGAITILSSTVTGFQLGIPHINTNGRLYLILPSGLAYGTAGEGSSIPANSVLIFTIDLKGFY